MLQVSTPAGQKANAVRVAAEAGPDPIDVHIGGVIRARRRHLGLSQTELADGLGLTFQQVQKYERGVNRVSGSKLAGIARALDCRPGDFFPDTDADPITLRHGAEMAMCPHGGAVLAAWATLPLPAREAIRTLVVVFTPTGREA